MVPRDIADVWELTAEELRSLHETRHINAYVLAGLLTVKTSEWPKGGAFRLGATDQPPSFTRAVDRVLEIVPDLDPPSSPKETRVELTHRLFELYRQLPDTSPARVPELMRLLAAIAFIPLVAERNDGFALWWHRPVRAIEPLHEQLYSMLAQPLDYVDVFRRFEQQATKRGASLEQPVSLLYVVTVLLVQAIIIMLENGADHEEAWNAFQNDERAMREHETRHELGGLADHPLGLRGADQLRYRNTMYLYGGNLLERMGRRREAVSWYLRDIDHHSDLPRSLGFYMTAFKTCERLLSAYAIDERHPRARASLLALIHRALARSFEQTRKYAEEALGIVAAHPGLDLSQPKLELGERTVLWAGEASREPLLVALLYRNKVEDVDFGTTDYSPLQPI
jgi:hypothetical protein